MSLWIILLKARISKYERKDWLLVQILDHTYSHPKSDSPRPTTPLLWILSKLILPLEESLQAGHEKQFFFKHKSRLILENPSELYG